MQDAQGAAQTPAEVAITTGTDATVGRAARGGMPPNKTDRRVAWRSRVASVALVLVLLAVSGFAVWSSQTTGAAAARAVAENSLSDDYASAAGAVATEESLVREYRSDPGVLVRASYDRASAAVLAALAEVRLAADAAHQALVDRVVAQHRNNLGAIDQLFAAVDSGDPATALRIEDFQIEPAFRTISAMVVTAAADEQRLAATELADMQHLQSLTRLLTPVVFLAGLLLAAVLALITRGHRRLLDLERARAVHDSLHDALTGLPNRKLLVDRFEQALRAAHRARTRVGLLIIDLDHFKEINDTFGHHYGDELLAQVGPRLTGALRAVDTVARFGGHQFAVLLPDMQGVNDATAVAAKLTASLARPFEVEGVDLDIEANAGIVLSGEHGQDAATLLQRADIAMYVAKTQNLGVFAYDPAFDAHSPARFALLGELRRALDLGDFVLHYQPKVTISTGEVVGAEALVRWQHRERGLVFPDAFIPLAEHTGLIGPLTRCVLDTALAQARTWADAGRPLPISVNLSARNLLDERLPDQVAQLLAAHGVAPELLELEVTESAIMTEPVRAQQVLEKLSALGVCISIDDFGAGYTSFGQLKTLPVGELKIDRSFVMTMIEDRTNALIVQSLVDLGHNLGLRLVAEGVESEHALRALAAFGCDVAQGYHLARPMTAEAFDTWRAGRRVTPPSPVVVVAPRAA
jgi:diguanylate cyclase (GGDEF)-like protein